MTPTSHRPLDPIRLAAVLPLACLLLVAVQLAVPATAAAGDWLDLTDETSTRLVAAPGVGASDPEEKDYAWDDVDRDGDIDLVVVRKEPFSCDHPGFRNVLLMNENGVLTDRTAALAPDFLDITNDRDVELVDVDGDGWLDIVTGGTFETQPRILMNLGESGGVWQGFEYQENRLPFLESPQGVGPFFCGLGVGDLTGDGRPELYFSDYGGLFHSEATDLDDRLLVNNGNGFFTDQTATRLTADMRESLFGTDVDFGDMNGDGFLDIVKTDSTGFAGGACEQPVPEAGGGRRAPGELAEGGIPNPSVTIFYNDGFGQFADADSVQTAAPYMAAVGDFTQDDRLDLFVVDDFQDTYLVNTGNAGGQAQFTTTLVSPSPKTTGFGGNVTFADMNNDGVLDVLVADVDTDIPGCDGNLAILQGQGTPPNIHYADPLGSQTRPWTPNGTFDIAPFDINGDGSTDLVIGTCSGTKIFMGPNLQIFDDGFEAGNTSAWDVTAN